jgi:hypothetical protein
MEMTMRKLTMAVVPLVAALTAQAATASEHRNTRTKNRAATIEQLRNSNAYATPGAVQSVRPDYDEGAMTSGMAGH